MKNNTLNLLFKLMAEPVGESFLLYSGLILVMLKIILLLILVNQEVPVFFLCAD